MLPAMDFKEIPIAEIDVGNEAFRISEELDSTQVLDSLREIGQLNPVTLLELNSRLVIVCGFRRVQAMQRLGMPRALARILTDENTDTAKAFETALWDNLSHRALNPLEKARVLCKLKKMCGVPDDRLTEIYLPILRLAPNANVLRSYLLIHEIHSGLRQCLMDERLTHTSLEFLAELPASTQESVSSLMGKIRLSASLQRKLLGVLNDLAGTTGNPVEAPLMDPQVLATLEDAGLSSFQKGEKVYECLYRLLNPRLSQTTDKFSARKKLLGLPGSIRINAHPFFEEPGLRVEFDASGIDHFRQLAAALDDAAQSPEMEGLFDLEKS
jgi:hypothetical protein